MEKGEEKRKAVIITIYGPMPNIGNRLQNYAVQQVLESLGLKATTISFQRPAISGRSRMKYFALRLAGCRLKGDAADGELFLRRVQAFEAFNKSYIHTCQARKPRQVPSADYYVIGSDQVWNPAWYEECALKKEMFLLTFAGEGQKVCFSPSFGVGELPDRWKPWFRENLLSFPMLGVREEAGANIIRELTGREAAVTIDPTLMLGPAEWDRILAVPKGIDGGQDYLLAYFLGGCPIQAEADLKRYACEMSAKIYRLADMAQPELYITGPSEFLYLVSHAKLVVTDSFHACVFSFLYGKPFLLYSRAGSLDMMSRMDTLLHTFGLGRKYVGSGIENGLLECDYREGYLALGKERKKLLRFLRDSMHL